jgi:hypothetical protein
MCCWLLPACVLFTLFNIPITFAMVKGSPSGKANWVVSIYNPLARISYHYVHISFALIIAY